MKVVVKSWHAIAQWKWDTGNNDTEDGDVEGDVCGICRVPYEGCCPSCKMPGDDCPLSLLPIYILIFRDMTHLLFCSLGGMQSRLSHALPVKMDWNSRIEAAMPHGPSTLG